MSIYLRVQKPLGDALPPHFAAAQAIYGVLKLKLAPAQDALEVEYDGDAREGATW